MPGFVPVEELFKGRHFDWEIVVLCVRWYLSFKLSYRDLVARIGERGIHLAHTTITKDRVCENYTAGCVRAGYFPEIPPNVRISEAVLERPPV